jgi:diadenosine tetraphosphate (Ap4A) HIT family hydrolase
MNKLLLYTVIISSPPLLIYFYLVKKSVRSNVNGYCAFCDPKVLERQKFYEDGRIIALYTHKPILSGHCLILPKKHTERFEELTDEEFIQIGQVIKKVNQAAKQVFQTSSYILLQKNGVEVGQSVPHVHFHYVPRASGDKSILKFLLKLYLTNLKSPLPTKKLYHVIKSMKEAIEAE